LLIGRLLWFIGSSRVHVFHFGHNDPSLAKHVVWRVGPFTPIHRQPLRQIIDVFTSGSGFSVGSGMATAYWWFLASVFTIAISSIGWSFFGFLRRNVLRLPKCHFFRAWAGIKEENGRTYPYSLRLSRSEEHTSELQSRFDLVCRLLLENKQHPI